MKRTMSKALRRLPRVTVFVSMRSCYGPSVMRGIFSHIAANGEWRLDIVRSEKDVSASAITEACLHRADGFIIAITDPFAPLNALVASGVPFVTIENHFLAQDVISPLATSVPESSSPKAGTQHSVLCRSGREPPYGRKTVAKALRMPSIGAAAFSQYSRHLLLTVGRSGWATSRSG